MIVLVAPAKSDRSGEQTMTMVALAHVRLMILLLLIGAAMLTLIGRLTILAASASPRGGERMIASGRHGLRADIVDRNGVPLARTIMAPSIGVQPDKVIGDKRQLAFKLAELLPEHDARYYFGLLTSDGKFHYLKRRATPELKRRVNALGEPGITFPDEPERLYPQSDVAAHALGYLNDRGNGVLGMEKFLNARLGGGADPAMLSIDMRVQATFENELSQAMTKFQAKGAAGIILDVDTGELISLVSLPTFNPNAVSGADDDFNRATKGVYELGSTFKPITMAAAIDDGVVTSMAKRYDARAPIQVGRYKIHDDHAQKRWLNVPETLIHSSNIVTARIADEMGPERMKAMFHSLGFDASPPIEIERGRPRMPSYWSRVTTMTTGYGHGISITPVQLAMAYAALVNGGTLRPATLMKVRHGQAPAGTRVFSPETSARMRQLLRLIALEGTGRKGDAAGYRVGGKTGTGERIDTVHGGYLAHVNVSTFAAAFPMDAPRYVVIAMLDSPVGTADTFGYTTAAWTAAPVVSRVIQRTGPMLGVLPDPMRDIDVSDLMPLLWHAPGARKDTASVE